jgi:ABC-type branched-subunit amino acid transport system ATPase component
MAELLPDVRGVTMRFDGVATLDNVSFDSGKDRSSA